MQEAPGMQPAGTNQKYGLKNVMVEDTHSTPAAQGFRV